MAERFTGRVKWFSTEKSYGFIERQGGKDVFFHASAITNDNFKTPAEGQRVEFEIEQDEKRVWAANVTLIS